MTTDQSARDLQPGEVVDLHLRGLTVAWIDEGCPTFSYPVKVKDGSEKAHYLHAVPLPELPDDTVELVRATPVDGVPRPGDVWRDVEGLAWFAAVVDDGDISVVLVRAAGLPGLLSLPWRDVHRGSFGPISLEYRPEPRKAEPEQLRPDTGNGRSLPCAHCGVSTPDSSYTECCALPLCDNCRPAHGFCSDGEMEQ